jgi:hypothetical protein
MIVVIAAIAIAWALLTVLIVGICRAARRGDQVRRPETTTTPSASRPDPHTARNRCWRLPADSAFGRLPRTAHRPGVDRV